MHRIVKTYIRPWRPTVNSANNRRGVWTSPRRSRKFVCFLGIVAQEVLDWTGNFLHLAGNIEQVHFVVFISYLVGNAACPCLDLVEEEFLFIVPRLADIDIFVRCESPRTSPVESSDKHNVAAVNDIRNGMIAVLACLDHFMLIKMFFVPMNRLLRSVVPTSIDPLLPGAILPCAEYLSNDGLCQVVGVTDMNPIAFVYCNESAKCDQVRTRGAQ